MADVGVLDPQPVERMLALAADGHDLFRLDDAQKRVDHIRKGIDLARGWGSDGERLPRPVRMKGHGIPRDEPRKVIGQHPPVDTGAILRVRIGRETGLPPIDGESRIQQLRLTGDGHARKAAAPRARRLGEKQDIRHRIVGGEIRTHVLAAYRGRILAVQIGRAVTIGIEEPVRGWNRKDAPLEHVPDLGEQHGIGHRCDIFGPRSATGLRAGEPRYALVYIIS